MDSASSSVVCRSLEEYLFHNDFEWAKQTRLRALRIGNEWRPDWGLISVSRGALSD
jgi:hypothetical protein